MDGNRFLNYTTKDGRNSIINRNVGTTRVADKWEGLRSFILLSGIQTFEVVVVVVVV